MPTTKPRYAVTETDSVSAALDDAALRWPEDATNRGRLLLRLIDEGHRSIGAANETALRRRKRAIDGTHGALDGAFGAGYLDELRKDWPE